MEIVSIGQEAYGRAQNALTSASKRVTKPGGPEVDDLIDLKLAEQSAKIATKVIKTGLDVSDSLLDILA